MYEIVYTSFFLESYSRDWFMDILRKKCGILIQLYE